MGVRNLKKEELIRLQSKSLDARFLEIVQHGLNCSRFEANAVLETVHEVYFPFLDEACAMAPPGKMSLVAVAAEEPPGKAIAECEKKTVCLTVHRGAIDDELLARQGPAAFRRARIVDLCQQAFSQDALLTREDLAHRVFFVGTRTISRDLQILRAGAPPPLIPLRSNIQDIGPLLSHRVRIVRLALEGQTTSQICTIMRHSPAAVANYISTFARCALLAREGLQLGQISFLVRRGKGLVRQYLDLVRECPGDKNMQYHLEELIRVDRSGEKKSKRGAAHERAN